LRTRPCVVAVAALAVTSGCGSSGAPSIAILAPGKGPVGTVVTLQGSGLGGTTSVTFGGKHALFRQVSDGEVQATVPPRGASGPVGLTTAHGSTETSVHFVIAGTPLPGNGRIAPGVAPTVASFYPVEGPPGAIVEIRGSGFHKVRHVRFGAADALFRIVDDADLRAVVPPAAQTGPINLVSGRGVGTSGAPFDVVPLR
jgi:IPT/TIG domain